MTASNLSEILRIEGRASAGRLEVLPYYWDPVGLTYVVAQQAGGGGGGGGAVTVADGADVAQGATTDAEAAAGNGSVIAILKRLRTLLAGTIAVSGTFWQATQPVSGPLTDAQLRASAVPISAAALPLPAGAAQDGTDISAPTAMPAGGAGIRGWLSAIWTKLNGSLVVTQATPANLQVTASAGTNLNTSALALDATVAKDATLTGGTAKAINRGGAKGATAAADVTSTAEGADHQAIDVQVYHGGVAKDPTAIRALTIADIVTVAQGAGAAIASAWPFKLTDGTNTAAVKAASTSPVAADPAAVVTISPNSPGHGATTVSSVLQTTANTAQASQINLAAPGAGLFHYIQSITITRVNNTAAAVAADTTARSITSANLGGFAHELASVLAAGGQETFTYLFPDGLKSAAANTATTMSTPAGGAGTKIRITVTYRIGP